MDAKSKKTKRRRMVRSELLRLHTHATTVGVDIHIWKRSGSFMARGSIHGRRFGVTLGRDESEATVALRRLQGEIEDGAFRRATDRPKRSMADGRVPNLTVRQLIELFLEDVRKRRGENTERDYRTRLGHILDFAERAEVRSRHPKAVDIDRDFATECRAFLMNKQITRNGRPGGQPKPMSVKHVQNCLCTLRSALAWALEPMVRKLPPEFTNPITNELIGPPPSKDPLRDEMVPLKARIRLVEAMDDWQLINLSLLLVISLRFDDAQRLLVSDVDFERKALLIRNSYGGANFNKKRLEMTLPLPDELLALLHIAVDGREEGPLFVARSATAFQTRVSAVEFEHRLNKALSRASSKGQIQTEQDRKKEFKKFVRSLGGLPDNSIGKELKKLLRSTGINQYERAYDIRGSVKQEMQDSGIEHRTLLYLAEHSNGTTRRNSLGEYTGVRPFAESPKYFEQIRPLLNAIQDRCEKLPKK